MPSLLPGYEYDIFISYRHNDNRSGWATDFVNALQEELAATIKEPLSIYFDKNPHDGLLETHNVDKSLEGKLKCLIFIPIISQTYCDQKSFAWQHEFVAFNTLSKEDQFGRDIKLSNGNVTSRILPVKIHELDAEDTATIENEIGGVLRAIEFIYKEPGVNRPLSVTDNKNDNLNKADYKNQINKIANAVKEIIIALKNPAIQTVQTTNPDQPPAAKSLSGKKVGVLILVVLLLSFSAYFLYPKLVSSSKPVVVNERSLAVLPFIDMSPDKDQEWFSDGLTEELLNSLAGLPELKLISRTSSFAFKGKNLPIRKIADSLNVSYIVEGSVRKAEKQVRITVQLIRAEDGTHLWSNTYDRSMGDIFNIQKDISENIAHALNVLLDEKSRAKLFSSGTRNVEAYEAFLKGRSIFNLAHLKAEHRNLLDANEYFDKSISLDPKFGEAYFAHSDFYSHTLLGDIQPLLGFQNEEIYRLLIKDLNAAMEFSDTQNDKINYQLDRIFFSEDWSEAPNLIHNLKNSDAVIEYGWGTEFLLTLSPELMFDNYVKLLENDPLNEFHKRQVILSLIMMNELDSALYYIGNDRTKKVRMHATEEWEIEIARGNFSKAMDISESNFNEGYRWECHLLSQLLTGNYQGSMSELRNELTTMGFGAIAIYNALGEYDKADSVAHSLDAGFLGPCLLHNFLNETSTGSYYFHLSATPNLSARLRDLGINPVEREKRYYRQLPVVSLQQK